MFSPQKVNRFDQEEPKLGSDQSSFDSEASRVNFWKDIKRFTTDEGGNKVTYKSRHRSSNR